jgi:hypothetical protein
MSIGPELQLLIRKRKTDAAVKRLAVEINLDHRTKTSLDDKYRRLPAIFTLETKPVK